MDNGDGLNNPARLKSHIHTGEWQSFEVRMRRRRVERLIVRAETALADGNTDEVREALEEARRLAPGVPQIAALEQALELPPPDLAEIVLATGDNAQADTDPTIIEAVPIRRSRYRGALAAAAVLTVGIAGAAGWIYRGGFTAAPFTPEPQNTDTVASAPADPQPSPAASPSASTRVLVETVNASPVAARDDSAPLDATLPQAEPVRLAEVDRAEPPAPAATSGMGAPGAQPREFEAVPATFAERTATLPSLDPAPSTTVAGSRTPMPLPTPDVKLASRTEPVSKPEPAVVAEDAAVRGVLIRYATAYSHLDAGAAQEVWPAVNRSALSRAFDGLASQQVSLDRCAIDVRGITAHATCAGSATWSPKIGNGGIKTEPRNWTFQLAKAGQDWQIVSARVQNK